MLLDNFRQGVMGYFATNSPLLLVYRKWYCHHSVGAATWGGRDRTDCRRPSQRR